MQTLRRYTDARDTTGLPATLEDLVEATRQDSALKQAVRAAQDADEKKKAKLRLPMWYTCGEVNGKFCEENITPAGIVQIDLDGSSDDSERLSELKMRFSAIPCILFAAVSVSGRGMYALARVPVAVQASKEEQKKLLEIINACVLYDAREGEHMDAACAKSAQRRFESYDPTPYYNPRADEYNPDYRAVCNAAFEKSAFRRIAEFFGGYGELTPGCAQTGLAMAATAVHARGRVEGKLFDNNYYVARAQAVLLGESGAGKTNMLNCVERIVADAGGRILNSGSDRNMEKLITETAAEIVSYEQKDNGRPDKTRPIWALRKEPIPGVGIYDEAGDEQEARRNTGYKSQLNSIRRRCFNRTFTPATTNTTQLPQIPLNVSYTDIQCSTPKAWAKALCGEDSTKGEGRRVLEFWLDRPAMNNSSWLLPLAGACVNPPREAKPMCIRSHFDMFVPALKKPDDKGISLSLSGKLDLFELMCAAEVSRGINPCDSTRDNAPTIIGNLSTLLAYARGSVESIELQDFRAAWAIYYAVLENRLRLQDGSEVGVDTFKTKITSAILDFIDKRGNEARYDSALRSFRTRGEEYKHEFERLIKDSVLVVERIGKHKTVRRATEEEMAKAAEMDFSEERKNRAKVDHGTDAPEEIKPRRIVPEPQKDVLKYDECDEAEKRARLDTYLEKHEVDHPLTPGQIDNNLRSLSCKLQANGMWDSTARAWINELCEKLGHVKPADKKRILRPIKKTA